MRKHDKGADPPVHACIPAKFLQFGHKHSPKDSFDSNKFEVVDKNGLAGANLDRSEVLNATSTVWTLHLLMDPESGVESSATRRSQVSVPKFLYLRLLAAWSHIDCHVIFL